MKDTDLVYELGCIDKNYARYWANAELLEVTDAAADYIEKLEKALATKVAAIMPRIQECQCDQPMIICDNRGCHCERCGLPERIDWSAIVKQQEKIINETLSVPSTHDFLNADIDASEQWTEVSPKGSCTFKTIPLPENEWYMCSVCHGKGSYLEGVDAHRSEGIVPCYNCSNGWIKTKKLYKLFPSK